MANLADLYTIARRHRTHIMLSARNQIGLERNDTELQYKVYVSSTASVVFS